MSVSFGPDALLESTIESLLHYIATKRSQFVWTSNFFLWDSLLTPGVGAVLSHKLSGEWTIALLEELHQRNILGYIPSEAAILFYSWFAGSNIAWHTDYADKSSMTIYLSKDWKPDYGGYFCWQDWDDFPQPRVVDQSHVEARMRLPLYNSFVHITEGEWHATTLTTPSAPPRLSLQLFFAREGKSLR